MFDETPSLAEKNFIEKRSPLTRWILTPIVLVVSASLIHALVIWGSWILAFFWPKEDVEANLWFFKIILANGLSSYFSVYWASITAPKFHCVVSYILASFYVIMNFVAFYFMLTDDFKWWDTNSIFIHLSSLFGAIIAVLIIRRDYDF